MHEQPIQHDPAWSPWPEDGLEAVPYCPACGDGSRSLLHEGLADYVFFCAPGRWNLYICHGCGSNYLDPRPTLDSIHLAYADYYTHTFDKSGVNKELGVLARVRHALGNGYRNWRYGSDVQPATQIGILVAYFVPSWRQYVDRVHRHLPRYNAGGRILDIGCGNGLFLEKAKAIGWSVYGIDPDPHAVAAARKRGLDVKQGGLEHFGDLSEQFDVVTLSHVIEHVHDPAATLRDIFRLLKPGGRIWIDTPNSRAYGHRVYGPHWRGLEPPRHLVIFTWDALESILSKAGFREIKRHIYTKNYGWLARASEEINHIATNKGNSHPKITFLSKVKFMTASLTAKIDYKKSEFITLSAEKPIAKFNRK